MSNELALVWCCEWVSEWVRFFPALLRFTSLYFALLTLPLLARLRSARFALLRFAHALLPKSNLSWFSQYSLAARCRRPTSSQPSIHPSIQPTLTTPIHPFTLTVVLWLRYRRVVSEWVSAYCGVCNVQCTCRSSIDDDAGKRRKKERSKAKQSKARKSEIAFPDLDIHTHTHTHTSLHTYMHTYMYMLQSFVLVSGLIFCRLK